MLIGNIPEWNDMGLLPPIDENYPTSTNRSPYLTNSIELVKKFATTQQRCDILYGYLNFRKELYFIGVVDGFQWIDGSFTEHIELIEKRPPNDIDVFTFYSIHESENESAIFSKNPQLFLPDRDSAAWRKQQFKVDAYWSSLSLPTKMIVKNSVYWYSIWSHKRDLSWKGFLEVPLSQSDDLESLRVLNEITSGGFNE
ncbi:DUF6932 family protein [Xenorhabdus stockiae]|uniref:DUF6932 family protein n=1 Tax=Xenorhabdus stockiae TaxID=351614 RepID=UPI00406475F6